MHVVHDGFDGKQVHLLLTTNIVATIAPRLRDRVVYTAHLGELKKLATTVVPEVDVESLIVGQTDIEAEYVDSVQTVVPDDTIDGPGTLMRFVSRSKLFVLYGIGDVFVLPSFEEGAITAVSRALAVGLPVVGSDTDGITQQIDHGARAGLVQPRDMDELQSSIAELATESKTGDWMQEPVHAGPQELSRDRVTNRMIGSYEGMAG